MRNNIVLAVKACEKALRKLLHYFEPGVRLTLIARLPGKNEAEFVLSQDNLHDLSEALARGAVRQQIQLEKAP